MSLAVQPNPFPKELAFIGRPIRLAAAGEAVFREADEARFMVEIVSGTMRAVTYSEDGLRHVLGFFFGGDKVGIPFSPSHRYTLEAVGETSYVRRTQGDWHALLTGTGPAYREALDCIAAEHEILSQRGILLGKTNMLARHAAFLLMIAERIAIFGKSIRFAIPQVDIASYLATTPETVCRSLRHLRNSGAIGQRAHHAVQIVDPIVLRRLGDSSA